MPTMANKVGRPGAGRAKFGLVRCAILPELKHRGEALVREDGRFGSFSKLMEAALSFYLQEYELAGEELTKQNHPKVKRFLPPPPVTAEVQTPAPPTVQQDKHRPPSDRKEPKPVYHRKPASEE